MLLLSPTLLFTRCFCSMLALTPQSGDSSDASLEVRSVALLHIAVFVARNHGYPPLNSPVVALILCSRLLLRVGTLRALRSKCVPSHFFTLPCSLPYITAIIHATRLSLPSRCRVVAVFIS